MARAVSPTSTWAQSARRRWKPKSSRQSRPRRRAEAQDEKAGEGRQQRAREHTQPQLRRLAWLGEGQHADEQAHGEADAAEHANTQELDPARPFRPRRKATGD